MKNKRPRENGLSGRNPRDVKVLNFTLHQTTTFPSLFCFHYPLISEAQFHVNPGTFLFVGLLFPDGLHEFADDELRQEKPCQRKRVEDGVR